MYPIILLTQEEMKARWDKNLCYNCDDEYSFEHRCAKIQLYMLKDEEEGVEEEIENTEIMFGSEGESGKQRSILSSPPCGSDEETEEFVTELNKICSTEWWSSPDPEGSATKEISDSNIESHVLNQPFKPIPKPKPNTSPNTRLNLNPSSLTINLNTEATQNLPSLSYPNAKTPADQTRPTQVINQNTAAPEPLPNKPSMNTNPYLIRPKPWPDEPPILTVPKPRTSTNATHTTETLSRILQQTQRGKTHRFHLLNMLNSDGQVRTSPVAAKARIRAQPTPPTSDLFLLLYDFQSLKVGMSTASRATFANAVHLHSANDVSVTFKLLLASHRISRTTATPYTTLPSPSEILGLSISSGRRCPSVHVSHLFDPFETGEFASGLAGGRPCSGTDPTPKPRHGSAPERVDRELKPFPDLKWAWSATKVHRYVDFRNELANWKDYGEEMGFSVNDLVKKNNDLGLSKMKKKKLGFGKNSGIFWNSGSKNQRKMKKNSGVRFCDRIEGDELGIGVLSERRKTFKGWTPSPNTKLCRFDAARIGLIGSQNRRTGSIHDWAVGPHLQLRNQHLFWAYWTSMVLSHYLSDGMRAWSSCGLMGQ